MRFGDCGSRLLVDFFGNCSNSTAMGGKMFSREPHKAGLRLSHTSALVMHWGKSVYRDIYAQEYVNRLDLSEGQELVESCNVICPWYSEIIINRKFYIRKLLEQYYKRIEGRFQMIILAAGADPLSLEALHRFGDKLDRVIEVDIMDQSAKEYIMGDVASDLVRNISFVQGDVRDKDLLKRMESFAGYDPGKPSFIVAEGISYFLTKVELERLFFEFSSIERHNMMVMDYLLSDDHVGKDYVGIPRQIVETVMAYITDSDDTGEYISYGADEVSRIYESCKCYTSCFYPQSIMEHCRKGIYAYFHPDNDGWVALSSGNI